MVIEVSGKGHKVPMEWKDRKKAGRIVCGGNLRDLQFTVIVK